MLLTRRVIPLLLFTLAIGLAGCGGSGDRGVQGEQGPPGTPGANADAIGTIGEGAIIVDGAAAGDPKESIYVRKAGHGIYDNYTATSKYDLKRAGANVTTVMIDPNQGFDHGFPIAAAADGAADRCLHQRGCFGGQCGERAGRRRCCRVSEWGNRLGDRHVHRVLRREGRLGDAVTRVHGTSGFRLVSTFWPAWQCCAPRQSRTCDDRRQSPIAGRSKGSPSCVGQRRSAACYNGRHPNPSPQP